MHVETQSVGATPTQPSGEILKAAAIEAVDAAANAQWRADMREVLRMTCERFARFTADDVFELAGRLSIASTHDNRAFGPVMLFGSRNRWCRKVMDFQPSRRPELHCTPLQVWESLLYGQ